MKTSLSVLTICIAIAANAQINQKTIALRKQYTKSSTFNLREYQVPESLQYSFLYKQETPAVASLIATELPKPSTTSIKKAFTYYNSMKKPIDLSGVLVMGYSVLNKQQFVISNVPEETVRFFPANARD